MGAYPPSTAIHRSPRLKVRPVMPSPVGVYGTPPVMPPPNCAQGIWNWVQVIDRVRFVACGPTQVVDVPVHVPTPPSATSEVAVVEIDMLKQEPLPASAEQVPIGVCPLAQKEMPL